MGSGGDGYCDTCRSTKCTCVYDDIEFFHNRWWVGELTATKWPIGSVVLCRMRNRDTRAYQYSLFQEWRQEATSRGEYLLIAAPKADETKNKTKSTTGGVPHSQ